MFWGMMWLGGRPKSLMLCSDVEHRLATLVPGWVTTWVFSDESSPHVQVSLDQP